MLFYVQVFLTLMVLGAKGLGKSTFIDAFMHKVHFLFFILSSFQDFSYRNLKKKIVNIIFANLLNKLLSKRDKGKREVQS